MTHSLLFDPNCSHLSCALLQFLRLELVDLNPKFIQPHHCRNFWRSLNDPLTKIIFFVNRFTPQYFIITSRGVSSPFNIRVQCGINVGNSFGDHVKELGSFCQEPYNSKGVSQVVSSLVFHESKVSQLLLSHHVRVCCVSNCNGFPSAQAVLTTQISHVLYSILFAPTMNHFHFIITMHKAGTSLQFSSFSRTEGEDITCVILSNVILEPKKLALQPRKGLPQHGDP
mmetsp:Transcript_683/g.841  ORF Transcript_683/g.841 Transcript_683/m.841 type:complete len:227 (+) Transcript_683:376-1056(+)